MAKQIGRNIWVEVQPNGTGDWRDIGGETRDFDYDDQAEELETTVRASTAKEYEDGFADINSTLSGLFLVGTQTPFWQYLTKGSTGNIRWGYGDRVVGTSDTEESTYKVLGRAKTMPYNEVVSGTLNMRLTSAIEEGTYSDPTPGP